MRSRPGEKRPCHFCGTPTCFQLEERTPRGRHVRWIDCCVPCGEDPAAREKKP